MRCSRHATKKRRGAALVELAVLLPLLLFLFAAGVDFARVYYYYLTITNCARNGALYGSKDETYAADSAGIEKAALADATNLSPPPSVSSATATDAVGHPCIRVTLQWKFGTITRFPGVPQTMNLTRTVEMRIAPKTPKDIAP